MNKNNAYRKNGLNKIKSQYCNTRPRKVNCCPEKTIKTEKSSIVLSPCSKIESDPKSGCPENQTKTEESSNILSPCSKIGSDSKSGCWIPNASKGKEFCNRSCDLQPASSLEPQSLDSSILVQKLHGLSK